MLKSVTCKALLCILRLSLDNQRACLVNKMSESNDALSCSEEDVLTNKRR
jgi:hypothetical protein